MLNLAKLATLRASLLHTSLSLSDCSIFRHTHTIRNILATANQRGVCPSLSLIGLNHDMSLTVSVVEPQGVAETFFFSRTAGRTGATSDFC